MKNENGVRIKVPEAMFLALYFVFAYIKVIYHTLFDPLWMDNAIQAICVALVSLFILDQRWRVKGWGWKVLVAIVFAVSGYNTDRTFLMAYGLLIMCADTTSFRRIVIVSVSATLLAVAVTVVSCLGGLLENREAIRSDGIGYALGFNGRSGMPFHLFYVFLGYLFLRKKKLSWLELLFWAGVNYLIYQITRVRLVYYLEYIVLVLYIMFVKYEVLPLRKGILCNLFTMAFPVVFCGWAGFNRIYNPANDWMVKLNKLLTNRLILGYRALTQFDLTLFGQYIEMGTIKEDEGKYYFYIDSGFLYSLMAYGLVFSILVLVMYSVISRYTVKENQRALFVWTCSVLVFSLVNNTWVDVGFNPLLMAFPILLNRGTLLEDKTSLGVSNENQLKRLET